MKKLVGYIIFPCKRIWRFYRAKNKRWYTKLFRWFLFWLTLLILYVPAVEVNFLGLFGYSPDFSNLQNPDQNIASEIYASNGEYLGKFFYENRSPVTYDEISPTLIKTLVSVEDFRFYEHHGVDFKSLPAVIKDIISGNPRGGSTITQQLIKNLYKTRNRDHGLLGKIPYVRMVVIKSKEWIHAIRIENKLSKNEILTYYLNTVDFGSNSFGIKTAAQTFFNKSPKDLTPPECAVLVGVLKAPTAYSPRLNPNRALQRRNVILKIMYQHNIITKAEYELYIKQPIKLNYKVERTFDGIANYYRQAVKEQLGDWLEKNNYNIYTDGLKIYTTLDYGMQVYAEVAVTKNMKRLQRLFYEHWDTLNPWVDGKKKEIPNFIPTVVKKSWYYGQLKKKYNNNIDSIEFYLNKKEPRKLFSWNGTIDTVCSFYEATDYLKRILHAGFVAIDPNTGQIKAYVGGIDFNHFKHDNISSKRQPGSSFKPFVYGCAIEQGWAPCDSVPDVPVTIHYVEKGKNKVWSPHNADWKNVGGNVALKYAFAHSLNTVTAQIADSVGIENVISFAHKLGIKSDLDTVPALCLGSSEITLLELVTAYCPFLNGGYAVDPYFVTRVEDKNGNVLVEFKSTKKYVLDPVTVFLMQQMFLATIQEPYGTTQALYGYDIFKYNTDFCGKTGTSSNYSDGWFVGVSPKIVAGSWVGAEERAVHFRTSALGEGNKTALPAYGLFMEQVMNDPMYSNLRGRFDRDKKGVYRDYSCRTPYVFKDSVVVDSSMIIESDVIIPSLDEIPKLQR